MFSLLHKKSPVILRENQKLVFLQISSGRGDAYKTWDTAIQQIKRMCFCFIQVHKYPAVYTLQYCCINIYAQSNSSRFAKYNGSGEDNHLHIFVKLLNNNNGTNCSETVLNKMYQPFLMVLVDTKP